MAKRFFLLVVVVIFLFLSKTSAQDANVENRVKPATNASLGHIIFDRNRISLKFSENLPGQTLKVGTFSPANFFSKSATSLKTTVFQKDFNVQKLSFFCQKEWQFEQLTSIPLRIRLGSPEYTDYLEKKPNSQRRP